MGHAPSVNLKAHSIFLIRCTRCGRFGRERVMRLIERWGRGARLPDVRHELSADCPHHNAPIYERCDLYFPQLVEQR